MFDAKEYVSRNRYSLLTLLALSANVAVFTIGLIWVLEDPESSNDVFVCDQSAFQRLSHTEKKNEIETILREFCAFILSCGSNATASNSTALAVRKLCDESCGKDREYLATSDGLAMWFVRMCEPMLKSENGQAMMILSGVIFFVIAAAAACRVSQVARSVQSLFFCESTGRPEQRETNSLLPGQQA